MKKRMLSILLVLCLVCALSVTAFADETTSTEPSQGADTSSVAQIGETGYETLAGAVAAANAVEGGATVELLADVTLGEKLTISGDVTIEGEYTITRDDDYTGTLFTVEAGAELTLDGGLTIDGGNEWVMDMDAYNADLTAFTKVTDGTKYFTPEEGAPVATAHMITVSGTDAVLNLNKVTIKNHYATSEKVIISAGTGATVNLTGATITHNAITSGSGLVVNASSGKWDTTPVIWVNMNEGTVIDGNHVGGNHGVFKVYMGTVFTMNGGSIKNTTGWNSNGVAVGIYWATFNMNGGEICSNSSVYGPNNGRNAAVYGHSAHTITMTGGSICHNVGGSRSGLDAPYADSSSNGTTTITGGSIVDNSSYYNDNGLEGYEADITAGDKLTITGGEFTQDVSQWCDYGYEAVYDEEDGVWKVESDYVVEIQEALLNGESVTLEKDIVVDGSYIDSISAPTNSNGVYFNPGIFNVVGDHDVTFDLNGHTITYNGHADYACGEDNKWTGNSCTIAHGLFLTNNGGNLTIVDSSDDQTGTVEVYGMASGVYAASPGSVITVEGGTWTNNPCETEDCGGTNLFLYASHGGELYIEDGTFAQYPSEGESYLIVEHGGTSANSVVDFSKTKVEITGGTFVGMNPTEAVYIESSGWKDEINGTTNVVAEGYVAVDNGDGTWTVKQKINVTVSAEPADAVIVIKDAAGNVVDANEDGTYTLLIGETYSYTVSKSGYVSESGTMTAYAEEAEFVFELEKEPVYIPVAPVVKPVEKDEPCDGGLECPAFKFSDVDPDAWYHEAIDFALVEGLMNGVGGNKFNPGGNFTRAMMWTVLARQAGVDTDGGEMWYSVAQEWAMANGVSDGTDPDGKITREQLVTMLWRYVGEPEAKGDLSDFVDGEDVSDWAEEAMIWAVANKVIGGRGNGILAPQGLATRAEVAQIFKNYFE